MTTAREKRRALILSVTDRGESLRFIEVGRRRYIRLRGILLIKYGVVVFAAERVRQRCE